MTDRTAATTCCAPAREIRPKVPDEQGGAARRTFADFDTVDIPGGVALVGTQEPQLPDDGEGPLRRKKLRPYRMGRTAVTNAQFAAFVKDTGHVTEAARFGWSFVFWSDVPDRIGPTSAVPGATWWRRVDGADWRDIWGPGTRDASWHADHPVVHVSWSDAAAFATWAGGRLPTEAEWEHAARGGQGDVPFPWGTAEPDDMSHFPCNIWQGTFPNHNSGADGWRSTAPAAAYAPNGYGLYNMAGNVWEWTADAFRVKSLKKRSQAQAAAMRGYRVMKGGSFLCHRSYCYRYRIAARTGNAADSTTTHQGFRVVWNA